MIDSYVRFAPFRSEFVANNMFCCFRRNLLHRDSVYVLIKIIFSEFAANVIFVSEEKDAEFGTIVLPGLAFKNSKNFYEPNEFSVTKTLKPKYLKEPNDELQKVFKKQNISKKQIDFVS